MSALERNNVTVHGAPDARPMMFAHGFGCDQSMWRFVWPAFSDKYRIVLFDHVGYGGSNASAFDKRRYSSLDGYAADVIAICDELDLDDVVFVGHSVSAMIGVLAATARPERFASLVLVAPSPRYLDDESYVGGFTEEDIAGLLESLESNYLGWSSAMAPMIMGNQDRPELGQELTNSFCRTDPEIAATFARATFLADNRADLGRVRAPTLVLQCSDDAIAPLSVGEYVHDQLPESEFVLLSATGHCPNLSAPEETVAAIKQFLARVSIPDELLDDSAEDLFENAPCGYLTTALDGTILRVNRTLEELTGRKRGALVGTRFQDLLSAGGRIYHETHYAPLLRMQGSVREIAVDIVRPDGSSLPALVNSVLRHDDAGRPRVIRTTVFDATDRRQYEQELLKARRREQEVALALQRGLLAGALQEGEGIEIGVAYRPADRGLEVGGDWYDAFWLEPGETLAIVVGDVVGRGLGAAATMGQLRSALRALASVGLEPGALLEALSEFCRRHSIGQMATVAYAEIDVRLGSMRYACAGHPPPAIVEPAGAAGYALEGRSPPLDAHTSWTDRPEGACPLPAGAMVVLYSDGLIERGDRPLQTGLDELRATIDQLRDDPPSTVASSLAHKVAAAAGRVDDVCVLALRLSARA